MIRVEEIVYGGAIGRPRGRPKQYEAGRICSSEDCCTTLSTYNPSETCYVHTPNKIPRLRGEYIKASA